MTVFGLHKKYGVPGIAYDKDVERELASLPLSKVTSVDLTDTTGPLFSHVRCTFAQ